MKFDLRLPYDGEDLSGLHTFDFTKLSATNTCPTWGLVRYGHHKVFHSSYRQMALEAGSAMHEVFAAGRCFDLVENSRRAYPDIRPEDVRHLVYNRASKIFGNDRTRELFVEFDSDEDERTRLLRGCLCILNSGAFYDDPGDTRRTITNLEEAAIAYLDRYEFGKHIPVIIGDYIGLETPVDLIITYEFTNRDGKIIARKIRFTGRIDGVHCHKNNPEKPYAEENKTASRLGEAFEQSFELSHQVTGYLAAATVIVGQPLDMSRILGVQIPQPKRYEAGVTNTTVFRRPHHFQKWAEWVVHTVELYLEWFDNPTDAPQYTHSCNRYFRACAYIPLCALDPQERRDVFDNEMEIDEWSPLHDHIDWKEAE